MTEISKEEFQKKVSNLQLGVGLIIECWTSLVDTLHSLVDYFEDEGDDDFAFFEETLLTRRVRESGAAFLKERKDFPNQLKIVSDFYQSLDNSADFSDEWNEIAPKLLSAWEKREGIVNGASISSKHNSLASPIWVSYYTEQAYGRYKYLQALGDERSSEIFKEFTESDIFSLSYGIITLQSELKYFRNKYMPPAEVDRNNRRVIE